MTARLPNIDGDDNDWGSVLNAFLMVSHANNGTLNPNTVDTLQIENNAVTNDNLDASTQAIIASVAGKYVKPSTGIPGSDLDSSTQSSLSLANSALQTAPVSSVAGRTGAVTLAESDIAGLTDDLAAAEKTANKDGASGYAGLDSNALVPYAEIPTGPAGSANKVLPANDPSTADSREPTAHASSHRSGGSDAIHLDQLASPTDPVSLNSQKITNLQNGSASADAAALGQVPTPATTVVGPDTSGAPAAVGSSTAYARADHDHGLPDVANKAYVDALLSVAIALG